MHLHWCSSTFMTSNSYHEQGLGSHGCQPGTGKAGRGRSCVRQKYICSSERKMQVSSWRNQSGAARAYSKTHSKLRNIAFCRCCVFVCSKDPILLGSIRWKIQPSHNSAPHNLRSWMNQVSNSPQQVLEVWVCRTAHVPGQMPYHLSKSTDTQDWDHFSPLLRCKRSLYQRVSTQIQPHNPTPLPQRRIFPLHD